MHLPGKWAVQQKPLLANDTSLGCGEAASPASRESQWRARDKGTGCLRWGLESSRAAGCGSVGFSLGCLHECVWGWACPRDIPELFWEAANLAGSWFSRSSRYVGISDETICLRRRRAKPSQARGMCHFEHSCGKCINRSLSHWPGQARGEPVPAWALSGSRPSR